MGLVRPKRLIPDLNSCQPTNRTMNSTRSRSLLALVFKTVLESCPLTRLLSWSILVIGTSFLLDHLSWPMHLVVTVPMKGVQ